MGIHVNDTNLWSHVCEAVALRDGVDDTDGDGVADADGVREASRDSVGVTVVAVAGGVLVGVGDGVDDSTGVSDPVGVTEADTLQDRGNDNEALGVGV